jgi:hypothetical protein
VSCDGTATPLARRVLGDPDRRWIFRPASGIIGGVIKALRTRAAPWFAIAAVLLVIGYVVHQGIPQSMLRAAAVFVFLGACIKLVGLMVRDNPVSADMVTKRSIEAGVTGWMADDSARKRRDEG